MFHEPLGTFLCVARMLSLKLRSRFLRGPVSTAISYHSANYTEKCIWHKCLKFSVCRRSKSLCQHLKHGDKGRAASIIPEKLCSHRGAPRCNWPPVSHEVILASESRPSRVSSDSTFHNFHTQPQNHAAAQFFQDVLAKKDVPKCPERGSTKTKVRVCAVERCPCIGTEARGESLLSERRIDPESQRRDHLTADSLSPKLRAPGESASRSSFNVSLPIGSPLVFGLI